eukprot:364536-Chlamydomonas_euryale.AAC.25
MQLGCPAMLTGDATAAANQTTRHGRCPPSRVCRAPNLLHHLLEARARVQRRAVIVLPARTRGRVRPPCRAQRLHVRRRDRLGGRRRRRRRGGRCGVQGLSGAQERTEPTGARTSDEPRADVGREHDERVFERHGAALAVGQPPVLHDLQQHAEHVRVRLFNLVKQHQAARAATHRLSQLAALAVANVACGHGTIKGRHSNPFHPPVLFAWLMGPRHRQSGPSYPNTSWLSHPLRS